VLCNHLRDRRDEWIELGAMEELRQMVLEIYDRFIGLEVSEVAVDCCGKTPTRSWCGARSEGEGWRTFGWPSRR
jgi:hypothetical protein